MKKVLLCIAIASSLLLYACMRNSPTAGNSSDVNTGTIYGKVVAEKDTVRGEAVVELFRTDTLPGGLKKSGAESIRPVRTDTTENLEYVFGSLDPDTYSVRVLQNGIVIGGNEGIDLGRGESLKVDIAVVIIVNQTFIITSDNSQHITVNNFYINNNLVIPDTGGTYSTAFAGTDTVEAMIGYLIDGQTKLARVRLIKNPDGSYRVEPVDGDIPVAVVIVPSGTDTATAAGIVTGYAAHRNGKAASGAMVYLRKEGAGVSGTGGLQPLDSTVATVTGFFTFDSLDTGNYYVEVDDHDTAGGLAVARITPAKPVCPLPAIIIDRFGTLCGRVPDSLICDDSASILIYELGRLLPVDRTGLFNDPDLPEATYTLRLLCRRNIIASSLDTLDVPVTPGDTTIPPGFTLNRPPVFISQPEGMRAAVIAGTPYLDTVRMFDRDGDAVSLTFIDKPKEMALNDSIILWITAANDSGMHAVSISASDGKGGLDTLAWTIRVKPASSVNNAPVFSTQPADLRDTVSAGSVYTDTINASDPDSDAVILTLLVKPTGMALSAGVITWSPAAADTGTHAVTVTAGDGLGGLDTLSWTIRVKPVSSVNNAPVFSSRTADMTGLAAAGSLYLDTVHATDLDKDPVVFAFRDSVAGMLIRDSIIAWTPADGDTGMRPVTMAVKDGRGGSDTLQWNINVMSGIDTNFTYPRVVYGTLVSGEINPAGEVDRYQFQGSAGDKVSLRVSCGNTLSAAVAVLDASNTVIAETSGGAGGVILIDTATLPAAGTYIVQVTSAGGTSSGMYSFMLYSLKKLFAESPAIQYEWQYYDTINQNLETESYLFQGTAGDKISYRVLHGGNLSMSTALLDGSNRVLAAKGSAFTNDTFNFIDTVTLPATGTYMLQVRSFNGSSNGTYSFLLFSRQKQITESRAVEYGQLYRDTLNPGIEIEMFRFQGTAGDKISLRKSNTSNLNAAIFDASDGVIAKGTMLFPDSVTLPATGTYTIQFKTPGFSNSCPYSFVLYSRQKQIAESPVIRYEQWYSDTIDPIEIRCYFFEGTMGDKVSLRTTKALASISDASFTVIAKNGSGTRPVYNIDTLTLPATGTYMIQFFNSTRYSFILYSQQKQIAESPVIGYEQLYSDSINPNPEIESYLFQGTANDRVRLQRSFGPDLRVVITIVNTSNGALVKSFTTATGSGTLDDVALPENGRYLMQVKATDDSSGGGYSFVLYSRQKQMAESPNLQYGNAFSDTIDMSMEIQGYVFQGAAGDQINLRAAYDSGLTVICRVYDFLNKIIDVGNAELTGMDLIDSLKIPADGMYIIIVESSHFTSGGYSLALYSQQRQMTASPAIQFGQTYTDTIDPPEEIETYLFQGTAGDTIHLILSAGSSSTLTAGIYEASGKAVATNLLPADMVTLPGTGTYLIRVESVISAAGGSYTMRLEQVP